MKLDRRHKWGGWIRTPEEAINTCRVCGRTAKRSLMDLVLEEVYFTQIRALIMKDSVFDSLLDNNRIPDGQLTVRHTS